MCRHILVAGATAIEPARFHFEGDDLFTPLSRAIGVPIGNLTSQHFANRYLSPVDHRAKDRLRIGAYLRYMDDMLVMDDDAARLRDLGAELEHACARLRLRLHPWKVVPTREGVSWLGFRILPGSVRLKRSSVARAKRRLQAQVEAARGNPEAMASVVASVRATFAHWRHADSWRLREQTLRQLGLGAGGGNAAPEKE